MRVALIAVSVVPKAVMMITGSLGSEVCNRSKASSPFIPGNRISRITRSGHLAATDCRPASAEAAQRT